MARLAGLETSPRTETRLRRIAAALEQLVAGAGGAGDRLDRYRDLALWHDPASVVLRDRRAGPVAARLAGWLSAEGIDALLVDPEPRAEPVLGTVLATVRERLPGLAVVAPGTDEARRLSPALGAVEPLACAGTAAGEGTGDSASAPAPEPAADPGGALAEALRREAEGDVAGALALAWRAIAGAPLADGVAFELIRLEIVRGDTTDEPLRARLRALETLPGLVADPGWVALQVGLNAIAEGRYGAAERALRAGLSLWTPDPLATVPPEGDAPPTDSLDLLRNLLWVQDLQGDPAGALRTAARVAAHPDGHSPRDRANRSALRQKLSDADAPPADSAGPGRSAPVPESTAHGPPPKTRLRSSRPDVTLVSLMRDDERGTRVVPYGPLSLVAALRAAGRTAELVDHQLAPRERFGDMAALVRSLGTPGPVIGLSCMADKLPLLVRAVAALGEAFPDRVIIAGGPGPSTAPRGLMDLAPRLDAVLHGEAEGSLVEFLDRLWGPSRPESVQDRLERAAGCPGVTVRLPGALGGAAPAGQAGQIVPAPPRPRLLDLEALPLPAYDAVDMGAYDDVGVMTARGCPYDCAFCDATALWGRRKVDRDVARVLDEIELLATRHGVRHIGVRDDTLLLPRRRVEALCAGLEERLPGLSWGCLGRADAVDAALVERLQRAGCDGLFLGLESGSDRVLQRIAKGSSAAVGLRAAAAAVAGGLHVRAYFIWGFPFEERDDFLRTFDAIGRLRAGGVDACYSRLALFNGTPLHAEYGHQLAWEDDLPFPALMHTGAHPEERRLVRAHPDVFPFFWTPPTPEWPWKRDFVTRYWAAHANQRFRGW